MANGCYLGIDVGSVSINIVLADEDGNISGKLYRRTNGRPVVSLREGLAEIAEKHDYPLILAVGATGSGRELAGVLVGADAVKNEITSHAIAAQSIVPGVRTIIEIGGQDSKIIILRDGIVYDFAMNTVCAAGTGSFLDRQAARLNIPIEEFGELALHSKSPVRIAGRCAVFAESDMIHKQQLGHSNEDIVRGLCEALVRNYLNNLAKGKEICEPVVFQGGVAANKGIASAFEKALGVKVIIPDNYTVMGAYGAALYARQVRSSTRDFKTKFKGFEALKKEHVTRSRECGGCAGMCEIVELLSEGKVCARWGDRCGKWSTQSINEKPEELQ
ncbi:MAG: acyl-CoA dehydratase activase [Acetivibrionales bacterium]